MRGNGENQARRIEERKTGEKYGEARKGPRQESERNIWMDRDRERQKVRKADIDRHRECGEGEK